VFNLFTIEYDAHPSKLNFVDVVQFSGFCFIIATGSDKYTLKFSDTVLLSLSIVVSVTLNVHFHSSGTVI
jgi:hypothetical protein